MFAWYQDASLCFVYLADVTAEGVTREAMIQHFRHSRWFTRGWTLQELLAPRDIHFYDQGWRFMGADPKYTDITSEITGINSEYLNGRFHELASSISISERMSWAARRVTTRSEDRAYSLLGIFGVNMPMLYGEGDKAFIRLQEEIMKKSTDQTILAWGYKMNLDVNFDGLLASSPSYFLHGGDIRRKKVPPSDRYRGNAHEPSFQMSNRGLHIHMQLCCPERDPKQVYAILNCVSGKAHHIGFPLYAYHLDSIENDDVLWKITGGNVIKIDADIESTISRTVFISRQTEHRVSRPRPGFDWRPDLVRLRMLRSRSSPAPYTLLEVFPAEGWEPNTQSWPSHELEFLPGFEAIDWRDKEGPYLGFKGRIFLRFGGLDSFILVIQKPKYDYDFDPESFCVGIINKSLSFDEQSFHGQSIATMFLGSSWEDVFPENLPMTDCNKDGCTFKLANGVVNLTMESHPGGEWEAFHFCSIKIRRSLRSDR